MLQTSGPGLSVAALFAEREARERREKEAEEQIKRKHQEELAQFKQRLENFQLTDATVQAVIERIKLAFDKGETELMLTSFPSSFCTDGGRTVNNADLSPSIHRREGGRISRMSPNGSPLCRPALESFTNTGKLI